MVIKGFLLIKSICICIMLKLKYGKRVLIQPVNSIRDRLKIQLDKESRIEVGNFLMVNGPVYIKGVENSEIIIGDNVFFNHNCSITSSKSIIIGDNCNIANNVVIVDHDHVIEKTGVRGKIVSEPVIIGKKVWIGANVTITKNVVIGDGAVVAAGSVVTKDIPPHEIWGGVPARMIRRI